MSKGRRREPSVLKFGVGQRITVDLGGKDLPARVLEDWGEDDNGCWYLCSYRQDGMTLEGDLLDKFCIVGMKVRSGMDECKDEYAAWLVLQSNASFSTRNLMTSSTLTTGMGWPSSTMFSVVMPEMELLRKVNLFISGPTHERLMPLPPTHGLP
jgi:hypothetical protein